MLNGVVTLGADHVPKLNIASFVVGIVLLGLLTLFVTRTTLGLSMRAAAEDLPAARLMGIKVNRVVATAFAIGAGLAAVAGVLYAVQAGQINPYMGFTPVLKAFIAAVIGGFGSIAGAVARRLRAGLPGGPPHRARRHRRPPAAGLRPARGPRASSRRSCPSCLASYRDAFVFVILILVLLFRPQGILGPARAGGRAVRDDRALRRAAGPLPRDRPRSIALAVLDASGQSFWQGLAINLAIFMILTVRLNLTSGFTGVFSLGQIGFMALGRVRLGDPDAAARRRRRLPAGPAGLAGRRPPRPGRRARSRSGSSPRR